MKFVACTSIHKAGYDQYGRNFVTSFLENWLIPLHLYSEDPSCLEQVSADFEGSTQLHLHNLNLDFELQNFLHSAAPVQDYRWDAWRFAKKVFAITDPNRAKADWWIWLDADIVTEQKVSTAWLRHIVAKEITYLGRDKWPCSECGFVAYRTAGREANEFLARFREVYTSGEIFDHMEWHDSFIFDRVREEFPKSWFSDLSSGIPGMHVFDDSVLGDRMKHLKGPLRKKGTKPDNLPAEYWSEKEKHAL